MSALLEAVSVKAYYGHLEALHGIDLNVRQGGITALLGANGAGKTTTLRAVSGTVRSTGIMTFAGEPILGRPAHQIARRGIGHVPDGRGTLAHLTVEENLRLGGYVLPRRADITAGIERMFGYFPVLRSRFRQQAGTLSGGEQQMLAISRALMMRPRLLLLDEPSFGLAPRIVAEIFSIMRAINSVEKVGILLVEQNAAQALKIADTAYVLETGRIVLSGSGEELRSDRTVQKYYLG